MKNPLSTMYLNGIEARFKRRKHPVQDYSLEEYKADFLKNTNHNFDDLKGGSFIKAKYLNEKHRMIERNKILNNYQMFEDERAKYHDKDGNLIHEKWKVEVETIKEMTNLSYDWDYIETFKRAFETEQFKINGDENPKLTAIFSELIDYMTTITVYEDKANKRINILIIDFNPDCYDATDALLRYGGKLYTMNKRFCPKDKYEEMEDACKYFIDKGIEDDTYFADEINRFPYAVGTNNWIKHYMEKLPLNEVEKYHEYSFYTNFVIISPITGLSEANAPDYFINGKLNWD